MTKQVTKYQVFQLELEGAADGNPYQDVSLRADFSSEVTGERVTAPGFYRGDGRYTVRFMPGVEGEWSYVTHSNDARLDGVTGSFSCGPAAAGDHGRVLRRIDVKRGVDIPAAMSEPEDVYKFSYEDGTPYLPFGTTCWGWVQQSSALQEQTLATLAASPFNMVRMFVLPMVAYFITDDPEHYPYQGSKAAGFDYYRFNETFFANLDRRVEQLDELGIQAQLVLFHECDKPEWGFSRMTPAQDDFYVAYLARRYAAYQNIWWEPAKEWDILPQKSKEDWRRFGRVITNNDPYGHLLSIQNCLTLWDYDESWLTHCSIQRIEVTKTAEYVSDWRAQWNKPIILDEPGYEGDFFWGWGSLTGQELVRRCWEGCVRGGYVTLW
ncbi:MAG: DUF5060 domain-containing protein [Propionibacteriaceae bacterium]|nr:DUF5060 domain-containing protein [Propionibacteriaceae bacterium]